MRIEVKQEHIDEGTQGCPCYCAVSLAVYDALKNRYKFTNSGSLDITNEEVLDIIRLLETKSAGPSSIPVDLLKLIADLIVTPLCKIINNSFSSDRI